MPVIPYRARKGMKAKMQFTPAQVKTIRKVAEREVLKKSDHKQHTEQITASMVHDNSYAFNLLSGISIGTGSGDRVGQEIFVSGILIRLRLEKAATVGTVCCRARIYSESLDTFSSASSATQVPAASNDSIGLATNSADVTTTPNDKFQIYCHKDQLINLSGGFSNQTVQRSIEIWLPLKRKFQYQPGIGFMKDKNVYMSVGIHAPGATGTVGAFRAGVSVYFSE